MPGLPVFPSSLLDAARDFVHDEANVARRAEELRQYLQALLQAGAATTEHPEFAAVLNHNTLEYEELEDLYYNYQTEHIETPNCPSVAMRNKVITGLMVYQGLNSTALKSLRYEHIHIDKGTIYLPSTRNTNSRELELKSWQIIPLLRYLERDRESTSRKDKQPHSGLISAKFRAI